MNELTDAVRALVAYDRRSPALLVLTPSGDYDVSPNGYGGGLDNVFVISRAQIRELMLTEGLDRDDLTDPDNAERLAHLVDEFHQRRGPTT